VHLSGAKGKKGALITTSDDDDDEEDDDVIEMSSQHPSGGATWASALGSSSVQHPHHLLHTSIEAHRSTGCHLFIHVRVRHPLQCHPAWHEIDVGCSVEGGA